jgi:hypothetical protein
MPKRSSKRPRDANRLAFEVVRESVGEMPPESKTEREKDPAAVALGRKGGTKGGKARAEKMTPEERREAARKAARARWDKAEKEDQ